MHALNIRYININNDYKNAKNNKNELYIAPFAPGTLGRETVKRHKSTIIFKRDLRPESMLLSGLSAGRLLRIVGGTFWPMDERHLKRLALC